MSLTSEGNAFLDKSQCRTCLGALRTNQHYLFEQVAIGDDMVQTASIIMACASVQIILNDLYPQYICRQCLDEALSSYAFRSKCEQSQHRLLEASHVGTLKVETTVPGVANLKVEVVDAYEVDEDSNDALGGQDDDDDYMPDDDGGVGGVVSSDDEVLASKIRKEPVISGTRSSARKRPPPRTRTSTTPAAATFTCRQCDQTFTNRIAFIAHRDTHTQFSCRICDASSFACYETLLSHLRKKHREDYLGTAVTPGSGKERGRVKVAKEEVEDSDGGGDGDGEFVAKMEVEDEDDADDSTNIPSAHRCTNCRDYFLTADALTAHQPSCPSSGTKAKSKPKPKVTKDPITNSYNCTVCTRTFPSYRALTEHKRTHKAGVYCAYCGVKTTTKQLALHRKREHSADMRCVGCEEEVAGGVEALEEHQNKHRSYTCSECQHTSKQVDSFRLHLLSHDLRKLAEDENLKCRECGEETISTLSLVQHYKSHREFTCDECETKYSNMAHLIRHNTKAHTDIDTSVPEEDRKCTVCGKQFLTVEGMWHHRAKHNAERKEDDETPYFCAYCDIRPKSNVSLGKHMQEEHHTHKTETCSICDKSFFSQGKLKVHMLTHNADKQHVCEVCGAGFALKGNLNVHMRVHTGEKPYKCEICDKSYNHQRFLCKHLLTHSDGEIFKCPHCEESFVGKENFETHLQIHIKDKPFACTICGKSFHRKSDRDRHLKSHEKSDDRVNKSSVYKNYDNIIKSRCVNNSQDIGYYSQINDKNVRSQTGKGPFPCPICGKPFRRIYDMKRHVCNTHKSAEHTCLICHKTTTNKLSLSLHIRTMHSQKGPFSCPICGNYYGRYHDMKRHADYAHDTTLYTCLICGMKTRNKLSLSQHIRKHELRKKSAHLPYLCRTCGKGFIREHARDSHAANHKPLVQYACLICSKNIFGKYLLRRHIILHNKTNKCTTCGRGFTTKHDRDRHMKTHAPFVKCFCTICNQYVMCKDSLRSHIRKHNRPPKVPKVPKEQLCLEDDYALCLICNKTFDSLPALRHHMRSHKDRRVICQICGSELKTMGTLRLHMRIHSGEMPYECPICGKKSRQKSSHTIHMKIHEENVPLKYICPTCGKGYKSLTAYRGHITVHSDERPFACTLCPQTFKIERVLKRHMQSHVNNRTHICEVCNKAFLRKSNLRVHMRIHTGETPHVCPLCGRGYIQKHVLREHWKTHLKKENLEESS